MQLIDSHTHLIHDKYDSDREIVIENAFKNNITHLIQSCDNLEEIKKNLELCEKYENIYSSVGIHPHEAKLWNENSKDEILKYTKHKKVVAIGECGLDYYYNLSPQDIQIKVFKEQIKISLETNLPLIIHMRDANGETINTLKEFGNSFKGVFHCYTGDLKTAQEALALGFYISFSGIITFKNAEDLRNVAKNIPLEKTLIETDCPFLAPIPHRGKRNEPSFVKHVAEEMCKIHNKSIDEIGKITSQNTKTLFGIK